MNTLSKETSQKIKELGIESDFYWFRYIGRNEKRHGKFFLVGSDKRNTTTEDGQIWGTMWKEKWYEWYPALSFSELLLALKEIGEKLGWAEFSCNDCYQQDGFTFNECPRCLGKRERVETETVIVQSHRLTDIFLEKGMEGVDKYISELIKS